MLVWASMAASTRSVSETRMGFPSAVAPSPRAAAYRCPSAGTEATAQTVIPWCWSAISEAQVS